MNLETVLYRVEEDNIAIIELNRPFRLNTITNQLVKDMKVAVNEVKNDPNVKAIIITAAGRHFCAGADLKEDMEIDTSNPLEVKVFMENIGHFLLELTEVEKPVICAVRGYAVGAGCNLALTADLILASEDARFSQAFVDVGAVPDLGGLYFLPRLIGLARAKELIYTGRVITAEEAERIGLINRVVKGEKLIEEAMELARKLVYGPTVSMGLAKRIMALGMSLDFKQLLQLEAYAQAIAFHCDDYKEGRNAFLEKRQPQFKGC